MILPPIAEALPDIRSDIDAIKVNIADNSLEASECVQAFMKNDTRNIGTRAARAAT